jgi:thioesterase domain-containing protein
MQTARQLQSYILKSVPLTVKMGVRVKTLGQKGLTLALPLRPNRNHIQTAFGGTLIAAQAVACWAWLTWRLRHEGLQFFGAMRRGQLERVREALSGTAAKGKGFPGPQRHRYFRTQEVL